MCSSEELCAVCADVEMADSSDFEAGTGQPQPARRSAARTAGTVAVLVGAGCGLILGATSRGSHSREGRASEATVLDEVLPSRLRPLEALHDGNVCDTTEELFGGLCYTKCALLTEGLAPLRTTPWSCCESEPCTFEKEHGSKPIPCHGFDVSGGGACPHKPGACLTDEELYLGRCYKKCSVLTQGTHPYRVAAATCCETTGFGCLNFKNDLTDLAFDVGGGAGDHDPSTPGEVHFPLTSLTEDTMKKAGDVMSEAYLRPLMNTHDGNICEDQEELHDGFCYKRCSELTSGKALIRTSPWTCCESHPCTLTNQHWLGTSIPCFGYAVSADGRCPHKPGACLTDEEMFMGECYKKCSLLTNGDYPLRIAAMSCCQSESALGCLNFSKDKTSLGFAVGGGIEGKEAGVHLPEQRLTEQPALEVELKRRLGSDQ